MTIFTAPEETRNGADWYWRIQKGDGAIHARVQAKRIQRATFGQLDENGTINIDRDQLHHLIAAAKTDSKSFPNLQTWVATYARYTADPPCGIQPKNCLNHGCRNKCNKMPAPSPSVWIAQAEKLPTNSTIQIRDIVKESIRLDCILPCIDRPEKKGPEMKGFALKKQLPSYESCVKEIQKNPALNSEFEGALLIKA